MSYPNRKVLNALIESYLNIRKPHWDLQDEEEIKKLSDDSMIKHKMEICNNLFASIKDTSTVEEWVSLAIKLKELEIHELDKGKESGQIMFGLFSYVVSKAILSKTLRAMRSYITSQIADEPDFLRKKRELTSFIAELENQEKIAGLSQADQQKLDKNRMDLLALTNSKDADYYQRYFNEVIKVADPKSLELNETDFSDFQKNANIGKRAIQLASTSASTPTHTTINLHKKQRPIVIYHCESSINNGKTQPMPATLSGIQQETEEKSLLNDQSIFKQRRVTRSQTKSQKEARQHAKLSNS